MLTEIHATCHFSPWTRSIAERKIPPSKFMEANLQIYVIPNTWTRHRKNLTFIRNWLPWSKWSDSISNQKQSSPRCMGNSTNGLSCLKINVYMYLVISYELIGNITLKWEVQDIKQLCRQTKIALWWTTWQKRKEVSLLKTEFLKFQRILLSP